MLRKRIIFSLIYSDGYFTQSRNFRLQKVGNLNWLEKNYKFQKIAFSLDEIVVIDASRTHRSIVNFAALVSDLVNNVFLPICAGGGISSVEDAEILFNNGADKILINSLLYENPEEVKKIVQKYGSQSVVASIDYKLNGESCDTYIKNGTVKIENSLDSYIKHVQNLNIGEIYLNSIDRDGTGFGYDFDVIKKISKLVTKPLIIAGGAGNQMHFLEGLKLKGVSAVATANLYNFMGDGLPNARKSIIKSGENIADWN